MHHLDYKDMHAKVQRAYLWIKVVALDQMKRMASARIAMWQTRVIKWYSSNSKRIHIAVAAPSTVAEIFLFLHRKISAAASVDYINQSVDSSLEKHKLKKIWINSWLSNMRWRGKKDRNNRKIFSCSSCKRIVGFHDVSTHNKIPNHKSPSHWWISYL